jgi:hypothetical protein
MAALFGSARAEKQLNLAGLQPSKPLAEQAITLPKA